MEIKTSIVLPDQVTMKGRHPFRLDIKCPVCGEMMRLRNLNGGCSDTDGNFFTLECDECGTQVCARTVDDNKLLHRQGDDIKVENPLEAKGEGQKRFKAAADAYMNEHFSDTDNEALAQRFGVDVRTIIRWAHRLGLQKSEAYKRQLDAKRGRPRAYTPEQEVWRRQLLAEVYPNGTKEDLLQLAAELGVQRSSLGTLARRYGIHRPKQVGKTEDE